MSIKNYVDDEFLYKILTNKEREIFARITALTFSPQIPTVCFYGITAADPYWDMVWMKITEIC